MLHALLRSESFLVVVDEEVVEEVVQFGADVALLDARGELGPVASSAGAETRHEFLVDLQVVFVDVLVELRGAEHVDDHSQLVVVSVGAKEGQAIEHHSGDDAPEGPHVDGVVVVLLLSRTTAQTSSLRSSSGPL